MSKQATAPNPQGTQDPRKALLQRWAVSITQAAGAGAFGGRALTLRSVEAIRGPRAGALEIDAGIEAGRLLRILSAGDCAIMRQFVPWYFEGEPGAFMSGRFVRLEAGWPPDLAETDIPLGSLARNPKGNGRWAAGKNETSATVTLGLDSANPHFLFAGQTGSGKTWAMRSALVQLAQDPENRLILIDAKWGDGLGTLSGLPGLVGPVATDLETAKAALGWAAREMRKRYEAGGHSGRVIVAIDEVQELQSDPAAVELLRRLVALGRGAGVHCMVGTQHPTKEALGDATIKRNLTGRLALRVEDGVASNVVIGAPSPRADFLLGRGDAYAVVPGRVQRLQVAYIPKPTLDGFRQRGKYTLEVWPAFDPEAAGTLQPGDDPTGNDAPAEIGAALEAAHLGKGRPWLRDRILQAIGHKPGGDKARRLLALGRGVYDWLTEQGYTLCNGDGQQVHQREAYQNYTEDVW
ncbi:MAG: DNA translocase SftA [Chloroflexi bacterium ADurb.Bin360]|nr:MAG: DNA translocase SftA [Chloroflexi bacterium ADurb.Bin360]